MRYATAFLFGILPTMAMAVLEAGGSVTNQPSCGLANGSIWAYATGGTPPYSFVWSPAPAIGQGTQNVSGLGSGVWTVTVVDALAAQATADFTLVNESLGDVTFTAITYGYNQSGAHHPCIGTSDGSFSVILSQLGGTPPYTITANGMPPIGYDLFTNDPYFGYFSLNDGISVSITDANGCMGGANVGMDGPSTAPFSADNINPACGGLNNGSVDLSFGFSGPYGPYLSITGPSGNVYGDTPFSEPLALTGLEPGSYFLVRTYNPLYFASSCQFVEQFTIPDLGPDCGSVSGRLFIDNNQNCAQNGGEPSVPYHVIEINPGPEYAITNSSGDYTRNLVNGNFTIEAQGTGTDLYPICPSVQPAPFTINYNNVTLNLADSSLIPLDLRVTAANNVARPGFAHSIWGNVRNLSAQLSGAVTLTVSYDPQMSYVGAYPTPTSIASNTLTWDLPAFLAYGEQNFSVQLQVPPNAGLLGLPFAHAVSFTQPITESTYANNSVGLSGVFQGAYDPNDKQVFTSTREQESIYIIGQDEWLDYTIRFQNTGTDTAFTVVVTDTISTALDLSTYEQGVASHPFDVSFKSGRVVEWRFAEINLPDSNVNEAASHGLVSFRIRPQLPLLPGSVLANNADIFFDFNDPIRTNDATLTAEFSTGVSASDHDRFSIFPNPAQDILFLSGAIVSHEVSVWSVDGREVLRTTVSGPRPVLEVAALSPGSYVLELRTSTDKRYWAHFAKE